MVVFDADWAAKVVDRLDRLETEEQRTRRRLRDLEGDRAGVRDLVKTMKGLAGQVDELARGAEAIADSAVAKALAARDEERKRTAAAKRKERREDWKYRMAIATGGAAIATAVIAIATIIAHL